MKNFHSSSTSKKTLDGGCREGNKIYSLVMPFTETEIIFFQKMLLTYGIHYVQVDNLTKGRKALFTLLSSIHFYRRKACISKNFEVIGEPNVYNLYKILEDLLKNDKSYSLEQLWAEGQHFDFLWIERSKSDTHNFFNLCNQAIQVCRDKELCVIVIEEKES
jgi:hypothetical protein